MAHKRHDRASKRLLQLWLSTCGSAKAGHPLHPPERQVDVLYRDRRERRAQPVLGILDRMAHGIALVEPFRNPPSAAELRACSVRLVEVHEERLRAARRKKLPASSVPLPTSWVLCPTCPPRLRRGFGLTPMVGWLVGFLTMPPETGMKLVVLHELPATPETLWLRLLARGRVQKRALEELDALPASHPLRDATIVEVVRWKAEASQRVHPTREERELLMNVERIVQKWEKEAVAKGRKLGKAEGKAEGLREGEARGKAEGKAEAVLAVLEARGLRVTKAQAAKIGGCTSLEQLDAWVRAAATVNSVAELLAIGSTTQRNR